MLRRRDTATVVTTAERGHSEDIDLRQRRYVRTQLLRVACIALGVLVPLPLPAKLACFVSALALPWFGVVMANAGPVARGRNHPAVLVPEPDLAPGHRPALVIDAE